MVYFLLFRDYFVGRKSKVKIVVLASEFCIIAFKFG